MCELDLSVLTKRRQVAPCLYSHLLGGNFAHFGLLPDFAPEARHRWEEINVIHEQENNTSVSVCIFWLLVITGEAGRELASELFDASVWSVTLGKLSLRLPYASSH